RPIKINFALSQNSKWKFSTEVPADKLPLSDVIETWISENAFANNYHLQVVTGVKIFYYQVRITLRDDKVKNFQPNNLPFKIYQFLGTKGIKCSKEVKSGTIYITLN